MEIDPTGFPKATPEQAHVPEPDLEMFLGDLEILLNRHSVDNWTDTPDYILAEHLTSTLRLYRATMSTTRQANGWKTLRERLNQQ